MTKLLFSGFIAGIISLIFNSVTIGFVVGIVLLTILASINIKSIVKNRHNVI